MSKSRNLLVQCFPSWRAVYRIQRSCIVAELTGTSNNDLLRVERTDSVAFNDREVGSFSVVIGLPLFIKDKMATNARQTNESKDAAISGSHQAMLRRPNSLRILVEIDGWESGAGRTGAAPDDKSSRVPGVMSCSEISFEESVSVRARSSSPGCGNP
jgi:hypothetical protein